MAKKKMIESTVIPEEVVQPAKEELSVQERVSRCNIEIVDVLRKYNCDIAAGTLIEPPNSIKSILRIVPKQ